MFQTSFSLRCRTTSRYGRSESLATGNDRRASSANECGSVPEYSASASRGSYSGGMRSRPLIIELITTVSGSIDAQQVSSLATTCPTTSMAAVCSSATPSPEVASAAMSRRALRARPSHMAQVCAGR